MNYVEVMGGLGNQLFQYAFAKCIEEVTGNESALYISFFDRLEDNPDIVKREYSLQNFNFEYKEVKGALNVRQICREYEPFTVKQGDDEVFYSGFWQDKKFCEPLISWCREKLRLREESTDHDFEEVAKEIGEGNSISLHVRRGDYLDEDNVRKYGDITPEYYKRAMEAIPGKDDTAVLYVFSDDIQYCKTFVDVIWQGKTVFMPMRRDYEDLYLLTRARHHIIANSTFSWWGAAVSNRDGITVAPANWFRSRDSRMLYLDNWVVI
ncbi:alpha-1,2-fucosyltransferase [Butyrivibrio sp. VCB2006]|uniref:alpha-1,2-fucosyltransferase n=1 Tax=Butyrivibrio sp. VCB2006 TaxID=1280679 RepID=UPI000425B425|nr:alpha-1,2-fucosyltransferase [Butyrivibrio sp. VCB2006]